MLQLAGEDLNEALGVDLNICQGELVVADTGTGYRVVPLPGRHGVWMGLRQTAPGN